MPLRKTFHSIAAARLVTIMLLCAGLALLIVAGAVMGVTGLTAHMAVFKNLWLSRLLNLCVGLISGIGGWFMLPALTVLIGGLFQEAVIRRVEQVDYPAARPGAALRFWPELWHTIQFTLWALFLNLLILPFYLTGVGFIVSVVLNTYLLGREFFESVAGYHHGKRRARKIGRRHRLKIYSGGFLITVITLLPLINLFVPIIATVLMVHIYHDLPGDNAADLDQTSGHRAPI